MNGSPFGMRAFGLVVEFILVSLLNNKIYPFSKMHGLHGSLLWVANVFNNSLVKSFIVLSMQKHNVLENFI